MMAYPISRGRFVNFVAFEFHPHEEGTHFGGPWVTDADPSFVQGLFRGWEKEVGEIVQVSAVHGQWKPEWHHVHDIIFSAWEV